MNSLNGRVAIVTGGGTGIGLGITSVLVSRGAKVAIVQRDAQHLLDAQRELPLSNILALQADIRDRNSIEKTIEEVVAALGRVDMLVNNASVTGGPALAPFLECSAEQLDAIVDTNLKGTFHVSQLVARRMVQQGSGGSIIHISSVGAYAAQEFASLYCSTKAAQVSLTQGMALELSSHGIRVNAIAPGDIFTRASAQVLTNLKDIGGSGLYSRYTPLGRRGTAEEIGKAVAFLASDEASFITGATLLVDGGFLAY
jgi:NAD(P)-dependent dehydrogenase (short-subunit alcohol dehydrogenase family)